MSGEVKHLRTKFSDRHPYSLIFLSPHKRVKVELPVRQSSVRMTDRNYGDWSIIPPHQGTRLGVK